MHPNIPTWRMLRQQNARLTRVLILQILSKKSPRGLRGVGDRFERGKVFLTDLVGAATAAKEAVDKILGPAMEKSRETQRSLGKIVLGTVSGDIHRKEYWWSDVVCCGIRGGRFGIGCSG